MRSCSTLACALRLLCSASISDSALALTLQAVARTIALSSDQLAALHVLHDEYARHIAALSIERQPQLMASQSAASSAAGQAPELSMPLQAAAISSQMASLTHSFDLQQEAYLHLVRSLVLHILTPYQTALLCAAAFPFLIEFPCIMQEMLSNASGISSEQPSTSAISL